MDFGNNSDRDWQTWGRKNPYYGVVSQPRFLDANLTDDLLQDFFASGQNHVAHIYAVIRAVIRPDFEPSTVLDYGCGVGRVVVSFAHSSQMVVGIDVSPEMLAEARKNCEKYSIGAARLLHVDELDTLEPGSFDLVHSFTVFQHIPVPRGEIILKKMISLLAQGGVGAIHLTYSDARSPLYRRVRVLRQRLGFMHGFLNLLQRRPFSAPLMQMNSYSMNRIFEILMQTGCSNLHIELSDHGGFHGAMLFFEKSAAPLL